jgi:sporulation protein YlmC with PRC-barrel domain
MLKLISSAGLIAAALTASTAFAASDATNPPPQTTVDNGAFIAKQSLDQWRAPKLVGIAVYGPDSKKVGKVDDVLMAHDGSAQVVVIEVGGFLGIGSKDVAVPFKSVQWTTKARETGAATSGVAMTPIGGAKPGDASTAETAPAVKTASPAAVEANQGYPDEAHIDMTEAQLKSAPDFTYAPSPVAQLDNAPANGGAMKSESAKP